jgi:hypothetical protein
MSGTIPLSMTQQFDVYGKPLSGGLLYLIQAGTVSTPQNGYQDGALSIPLPNPILLDAAGRIPQFFLADGLIKVRLQDKAGVVQLAADGIQVIGPSSGGGGGGTAVDPSALIQTGNMIFRYGVGALTGYVRLNGLTLGSSTSGATERANADCQNLFQYLWSVDGTLVVSGGRGASPAADWAANKQLTLPDWRGYALGALDDMGNSASGRISVMGAAATTLGGAGGGQTNFLATANLPPYTPAGSIANGAIHTTISPNTGILSSSGLVQIGGGGSFFSYNLNTLSASSPQDPSSFTGTAQGGNSTPFSILGPRKLCTFYLKL